MPKPIMIDTDPGIDDIVALTAAMKTSMLDVQLITTVAGNVGIENTTNNALKLVTLLDKNVPVAKGATEPILRKQETATHVHGENGTGHYQFTITPNYALLSPNHAVVDMYERLRNEEQQVTLVAIGPLTNIALLIKTFPEVKSHIEQIVLMGGAAVGGNATPVAEFNIFADPHAAKIVFDSGLNIVMCGLDVTAYTSVTTKELDKVKGNGDVGIMLHDVLQSYQNTSRADTVIVHDLCTIFYLLSPDQFTGKRATIEVVTEGPAAGCTIPHYTDDGNVLILLSTDTETFRNEFVSIFNRG